MASRSATWLTSLLLLVVFFAAPAQAAKKFIHWFGQSTESFDHVSRDTCNVTYNIFQDMYRSLGGAAWIDLGARPSPIYQLCKDHMSCILDHTSEAKKASLSSSGVILGLLPTLLAVLSPSIAEHALLSVHRPLLSILVSFGSPAVLQTRVFAYEDPAQTLDLPDKTHAVTRLALALGPWGPITSAIISTLQYLLVVASAANVLHVAIRLGVRAILSWGCTRSWPPILWAMFPVVIHVIGSRGYQMTLNPDTEYTQAPVILHKQDSFFTEVTSKTGTQQATEEQFTPNASTRTTDVPLLPLTSISTTTPTPHAQRQGSRIWAAIKREVLPCAAHPNTVINNRLPLDKPSTRAKIGILLNCFAGFLSCMHLLFGTVVFASLNFIDVIDAVQQVSLRFLASSIACRMVVLLEVAGMRGARLSMMAQGMAQAEAVAAAGEIATGDHVAGENASRRRTVVRRFGVR